MRKEFSTKWKASKRPSKQRKFLAKAPLHLRKKFVSVNLNKELRKKYEKRNVPVKKDDTIKVLRGKFKGKTGKISKVFLKISKVTIEGIQATKQDGSKVNIKMQPSNLQITALNTDGGKRFEKAKKTEEKTKKTLSETPKKKKPEDKIEKK
jgi:large subunit ribosomal protein L24